MNQQQHTKPQFGQWKMKDKFGLVRTLLYVHGYGAGGIWLRTNYGSQVIAWQGLGAFLLIGLFATVTRSGAMVAYLGLFLCLQLSQRVTTGLREWRGQCIHSRSWGDSVVARAFGIRSEWMAKGVFEPALCLGVGAWLSANVSEELGAFVMLGCVSLSGQWWTVTALDRARRRQRRDAEMEARYQEALYRGEVD